jgi:hypothetical protein
MVDDATTKRSRDKGSERKSKKRRKRDEDGGKRKHRKKDSDAKLHIVDDDPNDDDMWVEKNIDMDGERVSIALGIRLFISHAIRYSQPTFQPQKV